MQVSSAIAQSVWSCYEDGEQPSCECINQNRIRQGLAVFTNHSAGSVSDRSSRPVNASQS